MLAALKEGYHVHLEKPPAATVQEVDRMIAALRDSGRMCLVGFQAQHSADLRFVKERVVSGRLGDVLSASCHAGWPRGRSYYSRNEWAGKLRRGDAWVLDGPAINALAHQTMNLLYLVSRRGGAAVPTAARGEMYAAGPVESHNIASFELRTDAGANCYVSLAHCTQGAWHPTIDVDCSLGRVSWQMSRGATITYKDGTSESCPADSGQIAMVRNFVEALEADDPSRLRVDLPMARNMVLALDGAHESSRRVHRVPDQYVRTVDDDPRAVVDGLDEMLKTAAERRCLLSDLSGAPPWTVRTDWFDLRDYSRFPVQFEP
jgi:predicted dehydrogenase